MMVKRMISILMAAYNGERYIAEQIESLLNQSVQDFVLYINDDCSTDHTYEIAKCYEFRYPEKIIVTRNEVNSGSSKHNFLKLMVDHRDDYLMLCDQDDVWLPDKIKKTLIKLQQMEEHYGKDKPLLVYTDLKVVDEKLNMLDASLMHRVNADFTKNSIRDQLVQNTVTGCTVMYNRAAADMLYCIPEFTVMHDWWLMLIVSALGKAEALKNADILYRQHGDNSVGTRNMHSACFMLRFFFKRDEIRKALKETYCQADSLWNLYEQQMPEDISKLVRQYAEIDNKTKIRRILTIMRLGIFKQGIFRRIAQILYC